MAHEIWMTAKFPGKCTECGRKFPQGTEITFDLARRTAKHKVCPEVSYDGAEQVGIFETWVQRAQEADKDASNG